jgi:hypothetical protein
LLPIPSAAISVLAAQKFVPGVRRDGEQLPLLAFDDVAAGERASRLLDIRGDGLEAFRLTTPVLSITLLRDDRCS